MARDLDEAHIRFSNTENIEVTTQWLSWPEYEAFTANLNAFLKLADSASLTEKLVSERRRYEDLRKVLRGTPLHPRECFDSSSLLAAVDLGSQLGIALSNLRESVRTLSTSDNPSRIEMIRFFATRKASAKSDSKIAYILVAKKWVPKVNEVLRAEAIIGEAVQATYLTQLRELESTEIMVIFGAPENYANYFKSGIEKSREVAWLFNSPAARRILMYQFADCLSFDVSLYEIWPGAGQFQHRSLGERPTAFIESFEPVARIEPINVAPPSHGDPVVEALVVHLFNGRYIYYSDLVPPKATCVRSGEFEVEIDEIRASSLQPGDVLLIRTGAASHSFLSAHAKVWLVEKYDESEAERIFEIVDTYKKLLQTKYDDPGFISGLVKNGMEEVYVRNQILRAFIGSTIATQRPENFIQIAQALGLDYGQDAWHDISKLQTAHRRAGHIASQELKDIVRENDSWQDLVNEPGIARLRAGSIGEMILIPVVQKPDQIVKVSVGSLGQLQSELVLFH